MTPDRAAPTPAAASEPRAPHPTVETRVWIDCDVGIVEMVDYLNTIPGVRTYASCQGTIGEGGPEPYRAQVGAIWPANVEARLLSEFDVTMLGDHWGYLHPREGWRAASARRPPAGEETPSAWAVYIDGELFDMYKSEERARDKVDYELSKRSPRKFTVVPLYRHPAAGATAGGAEHG